MIVVDCWQRLVIIGHPTRRMWHNCHHATLADRLHVANGRRYRTGLEASRSQFRIHIRMSYVASGLG